MYPHPSAQALPALTHHEILALAAPCIRAGLRVDLAASQRGQRRVAFVPIEHAPAQGLPALRETVWLDLSVPDRCTLQRRVDHPGGLQGSLETSGTDLQALLARLQAVPPQRHFATGDGWVLALAHELDPALRLSRAEAEVAGLHLTLRLPAMHRIPGELEISVAPGDDIELPEDLLAVLGWQWSRLTPIAGRWTVALRPRGQGPQRTADAERRLQEALAHLAHTLAEPPARFHERQLRARWRFTLRRAVPLAGCFALMGAAVALPQLDLAPDSVFRMLIFNGPPILMVALFSMRELPRVEIPPRPRASTAPAWRPAPPARPTPLQGDPCPPTR